MLRFQKILTVLFYLCQLIYQNDSQKCDFESGPTDSFDFITDLSMIPFIFKPFVYYYSIFANNIQSQNIPDRIFSNLCTDEINLSNNHLENFSVYSFSGIVYLETLLLNENRIVSISNLIKSLDVSTLITLDLSRNRIQRIEEKFPPNFGNINNIYLQNNYIELIEDFVFENLKNLTELNLNSNRIRLISKFTFVGMDALKKLFLSYNFIEAIADVSFLNLTSLVELQLNANNIRLVNFILRKNSTLQILDLNSNSIKDLKLEGLWNLVNLGLSKNCFIFAAISIKDLFVIETLDLSNVELGQIKLNSLSGLGSLIRLYLSQAKIERIDSGAFRELVNLQILLLNNNMLRLLQNGIFEGLSSAYMLNLRFNIISEIDATVFKPLISLSILELSNNLIRDLSDGLFDYLKNIQYIDISFNRISRIKTRVFCNLSFLIHIFLKGNQIETIEQDAFLNLTMLSSLDLSQNKLKLVRNFIFQGLSSLSILKLNENRINNIESNSFRNLNLNNLDFSNNFIINIDSFAFRDLTCLSLNLEKTQIGYINSNIFTNSSINIVIFNNNFLESVSLELVCQLSSTSELHLSFNRLKSISLDKLSCSDMSLQPVKLNKLYLDHNQLSNLSFLTLKQLSNLYLIDVSFNRIECLESNDFRNLEQLKSLIASNNPIKHIDCDLFDQFFNLKTLKLVNISMPLNLFVSNLDLLDLSQNEIREFKFLENQTYLKELYLRRMNFNFSNLDFTGLSFLEILDLSDNVDDRQFTFSSVITLKNVTLSNMKIISLSRFEFPKMYLLSYLNISFNQLSFINKSDIDCSLLIVLDLSYNQIQTLDPDTFQDMLLFKELYLNHNYIRQLPINFRSSINTIRIEHNVFLEKFIIPNHVRSILYVDSLDISNNAIISIDFGLFTNTDCGLKTLVINQNQLVSIDNRFLENFKQLETLKLESNFLNSIEPFSFRNNEQLVYLNLAENSLWSLDSNIFSNLLQLKYLSLSRNRLEYIDETIFSRLVNIETLDISYNRLKIIENNALIKQVLLKDLYLNENEELRIFFNSLVGLQSIINIHISFDFLNNSVNEQALLKSLVPHKEDPINGVPYYKSINLLYEIDANNPKVDCDMVLEFLKNNLQINLKTDFHLQVYLSVCQNTDFYINHHF